MSTAPDTNMNTKTLEELKNMYIDSMSKMDRIAYEIAIVNLETSYDMEKSIGFIHFINTNNYKLVSYTYSGVVG